jgi:hypothetical protein
MLVSALWTDLKAEAKGKHAKKHSASVLSHLRQRGGSIIRPKCDHRMDRRELRHPPSAARILSIENYSYN